MGSTSSTRGDTHGEALVTPRFRRAAAAVVEDASVHVGDVAWLVTCSDGEDVIVLCAAGETPQVRPGERIRISPDEDVSVALELPDGSQFGTLSALGAAAGGRTPLPLVRRLADLLNAVLGAEWDARESAERAEAESRRAAVNENEALHDPLTGLANRRAWDRALEAEERRCRRYGHPTAVLVVDLDGLKSVNDSGGHVQGDRMLCQVARVLEAASRDSDVVARIGGDEFAVLALGCDEPHLRVLTSRLRRAVSEAGLSASVGGACRLPGAGLAEAWAQADAAMYCEKHRRRDGTGWQGKDEGTWTNTRSS